MNDYRGYVARHKFKKNKIAENMGVTSSNLHQILNSDNTTVNTLERLYNGVGKEIERIEVILKE